MNTTQFLLAKYIPDMHRFEPRNIGVIVWSPLGIEARFLAENPQRPGEVDGRSIPGFVTSVSAYKQWIRYWRDALSTDSIEPLDGGVLIPASSPAFVAALQQTGRGNFVIADAGALLDDVAENDLSAVANQLYSQLVLEVSSLDETVDRSFNERCDVLLAKTHLKDHRHFHNRYPVKCTVRGVEEEYVFSHAIANGTIDCLIQRFPLPKSKKNIQKSRDAMAWILESLTNGKIVTPDQAMLIVDATPEQQSQTEVEKTLKLLGDMSRVVNIDDEAQAEAAFAAAAKLP